MSSYDVEDYLNIDPTIVRMRITSDNDDPLVAEMTTLMMQIVDRDGTKTDFGGSLVTESKQDLSPSKGLFSFGYQPEHIYELKFDEEAIESFSKLKNLMEGFQEKKQLEEKLGIEDDRKRGFTISVGYNGPIGDGNARLIVEVMLNKKEGYFTLLDKIKFSSKQN